MTDSITIPKPDDWHVHFRDGELLAHTVKASAKHFHRVLAMPNLQPPLTSQKALEDYRDRILAQAKDYPEFTPYMTFYLNETLSPDVFIKAKQNEFILGAKLYPAGVTTNSAQGARSIQDLYPLFDVMQAQDMVLQIHGEVLTGDIFDRELLFLDAHLKGILKNFPKLRVVLEHISTKAAAQFVLDGPKTLAATITAHHLLYNRNQLLSGGIHPHYYCLPILKRDSDQKALQSMAVSGSRKFFAGTDSAPHAIAQKECAKGCAGIYSSPFALSMYAQVFEQQDALDKLGGFLSQFGADFYQLPQTNNKLTLVKKAIEVPSALDMGGVQVVPAHAGSKLAWSVE